MGLFGKIKDGGPVVREQAAELHWDTEDPFMFASHHFDDYPRGNRQQAPPLEEIKKRSLGHDYRPQYGYRMYGGKVAPGFPLHTHWGYETITICTEGYVDHFDSLGNQGRFGYGDVQWITASSRYGHCEMYPLAFADRDNHHRVTQIMMHIPNEKKNKGVEINNVWAENVPCIRKDGCVIHVYAGTYEGMTGVVPNKDSWAADPSHHVRIVSFEVDPGVTITLDPTVPSAGRNVYLTDSGATVRQGLHPADQTQDQTRCGSGDNQRRQEERDLAPGGRPHRTEDVFLRTRGPGDGQGGTRGQRRGKERGDQGLALELCEQDPTCGHRPLHTLCGRKGGPPDAERPPRTPAGRTVPRGDGEDR